MSTRSAFSPLVRIKFARMLPPPHGSSMSPSPQRSPLGALAVKERAESAGGIGSSQAFSQFSSSIEVLNGSGPLAVRGGVGGRGRVVMKSAGVPTYIRDWHFRLQSAPLAVEIPVAGAGAVDGRMVVESAPRAASAPLL
jgi:hypothetical protein